MRRSRSCPLTSRQARNRSRRLLVTAQSSDTPRSATVAAVTDCEIAVVDRRRLFLVQQTPSFAPNVMKVLSHRLREMNRRYRY
jgi:CRP-like cAMP-binding protein